MMPQTAQNSAPESQPPPPKKPILSQPTPPQAPQTTQPPAMGSAMAPPAAAPTSQPNMLAQTPASGAPAGGFGDGTSGVNPQTSIYKPTLKPGSQK